MDEDAGVRWLTQSKTAIGHKEQWHKQHHDNLNRESLMLENIWKKNEGGSAVLILHKLVILQVEGVQQVHNFHFWTLCSGRYMGSLQLEVLPSTEHARLVATVRGILKQVGVEQVTIEVTSVD